MNLPPLTGILASLLVVAWPHCSARVPEEMGSIRHVTFQAANATPLQAIVAIGIQTKQPIGIEFGENPQRLCELHRSFDIKEDSADGALKKAISDTGYAVRAEDGVLLVVPPDLANWQLSMLTHEYRGFTGGARPTTMAGLAAILTGWMQAEVGHVQGFGGSILHSTTAEELRLRAIPGASTEEIANQIVSLGSKGIWILRPTTANPAGAADEEIRAYSYKDDIGTLHNLSCGR